nr:MAG TPA: hypothetical protein [Caudoviricetes sp.]
MAIQDTFDGFETIGSHMGFMERRTRNNLKAFFEGRALNESADTYAALMTAIAHNIDSYLALGKNISTLADSYNNAFDHLRELYPETVELDEGVAALLREAAR